MPRKGKRAKPTQVHVPKTRYRRVDKVGEEYCEDWFEQQIRGLHSEDEVIETCLAIERAAKVTALKK